MADHPPAEDLSSLLALYLIDLRSQYEAELRSLTNAQRSLEQYRGATTDEGRRQFKITVLTELRMLDTVKESVRDALEEAVRQADKLDPPERR